MNGVRILVAEDENSILKLVARYLQNEGFTVYAASDGEEAMDIWLDMPVDLAILDVMMPKLDGWEVLTEIRMESDIPVIMLTARREEADKLLGFELGTDDYMTKPFSPRELVMRVKALLKRTGKLSQSTVIDLPGLKVNTKTQSAQTPEGDISLSSREYELLIYLVDNKGIVLPRERILERIWGYDFEGDTRVLDTTIKRLRAKLGSCGSCIKTHRGNGYMFEADK